MQSGDFEKLRQSIAGTLREDELKKAIEISNEEVRDSYEKKDNKPKKTGHEIEEEIAEDIDDDPVDIDFEIEKSTSRAESHYHGKLISIRKARPISATYNDMASHRPLEPIYAALPSRGNVKEASKNEFKESTPFQKMSITHTEKIANSPSSKISNMKESKDVPSSFAMRGSKPEKNTSVFYY